MRASASVTPLETSARNGGKTPFSAEGA